MIGFPKHLNTKQDYLNLLPVMPEETKAALQKVFEGRFSWMPTKKLKASENPKETEVKKIVELPVENLDPEAEPQVERWLYELKEDENAWFFRLGFTVQEAQSILNS